MSTYSQWGRKILIAKLLWQSFSLSESVCTNNEARRGTRNNEKMIVTLKCIWCMYIRRHKLCNSILFYIRKIQRRFFTSLAFAKLNVFCNCLCVWVAFYCYFRGIISKYTHSPFIFLNASLLSDWLSFCDCYLHRA